MLAAFPEKFKVIVIIKNFIKNAETEMKDKFMDSKTDLDRLHKVYKDFVDLRLLKNVSTEYQAADLQQKFSLLSRACGKTTLILHLLAGYLELADETMFFITSKHSICIDQRHPCKMLQDILNEHKLKIKDVVYPNKILLENEKEIRFITINNLNFDIRGCSNYRIIVLDK